MDLLCWLDTCLLIRYVCVRKNRIATNSTDLTSCICNVIVRIWRAADEILVQGELNQFSIWPGLWRQFLFSKSIIVKKELRIVSIQSVLQYEIPNDLNFQLPSHYIDLFCCCVSGSYNVQNIRANRPGHSWVVNFRAKYCFKKIAIHFQSNR